MVMDNLRRRIPFQAAEDEDNVIYDEQQQEFVIEKLRQEANAFNRWAFAFLRVLVGLSCIIQLLFNNRQNNPLLAIFSPKESIPSAPLRIIFSVSSFLIHYLLAVILSSQFRVYFYPFSDHTPVSYRLLYSISVLAPTMSLYFEIPWKVAFWWSYTPLVVVAVQRVTNSIEDINRDIVNLEDMKYKAPGA